MEESVPRKSGEPSKPSKPSEPSKTSEPSKPAKAQASEAPRADEPATGDLGTRASGRPRATPEPDTRLPTKAEIKRAKGLGLEGKPKQYTRIGDVWRFLRYKAGRGKLGWEEWLETSRGSRGGGPNHQAIQDHIVSGGGEREVPVGAKGDNAADAMWPKGTNDTPRDTYHQIGELNDVRGDPINRERINFEQMYNYFRRTGKKVDMWFWDRNSPTAKEPVIKLTTDRPLADQPAWTRAVKPK
jgi:hypothetical protein